MIKIKSQISADFIIVLTIALAVFLAVFVISDQRSTILDSYRVRLYAKQEADALSSEINSVFLAGDGTNKIVFLPATLKDNTPYNITVYPSGHTVSIEYYFNSVKKNYESTIITANVSGNISGISGQVKLSNVKGGVIIEK